MLHPTDSSSSVFVTPRHKISWKIGDIASEQAHALISSQGVCSRAILTAAGPQLENTLKTYQVQQPGKIIATPGYLLACDHVIHTCCTNWDGVRGNGEATLRSIVHKSLVKVNELGGISIAFPLIGTGRLAFPPREASRIMLEEAVSFCQNNPHSLLNDIRFILFHGDQGVIDAFKQESNAVQEKYQGVKCRETVEVVQGDLTQETTEAIVNIIGTDMNMCGAGTLSQAVAKVSGIRLEDECAIQGITPGQHLAGTAIMTRGGNLAAPYIIHMVTGSTNRQHLQLCVEKCLQLAEESRLKTISLPAVGTGAGSLSDLDSARVTFQALSNVLGSCVYLRQVRIVLNQAKLMKPFLNEQKFTKWQENKQLLSSSPMKSEEPPRKKRRVEQHGVTDQHQAKPSVRGISPVKRSADGVKCDLAEASTTTRKVHHQRKRSMTFRNAPNNTTSRCEVMSLPSNWDPMPRIEDGKEGTVHTVRLSRESSEYNEVANKFHQTAGSTNIVTIERIQNPHLYQTYQLKKKKMNNDNGGNSERQLFHGTRPDNVVKINNQGFNRSFSILKGTSYGKGVYFAKDASYSLGYPRDGRAGGDYCCMYLSRVLVGEYCKGTPSMIVPPPKHPSRPEILFDSVVNDTIKPTIFVVFSDNQCYPEYLITFSCD